MPSARRLPPLVALAFALAVAASAQSQPAPAQPERPAVVAAASPDRVRFAAPNSVARLRLEVLSASGEVLAELSSKGSVLDWTLSDSQGARLLDGQYLCVLTVKDVSGRITQRLTLVDIAGGVAAARTAAPSDLTAGQSEAVGPVEAGGAGAVGGGDAGADAPAAALLAHDGEQGQLVTTSGDLSFRGGDFFTGKDKELMRLSADGSLEVTGSLLARGGIRFPDGTVLNSARGLAHSGRGAKGEKAGASAAGGDNATPSAIVGRLAKFSTAGGALTDSLVFEDAAGNIGIGTDAPGGVFDVKRESGTDILQRVWNSGTGGAKLRYVAGTGATSQMQFTDGTGWLMSIAGSRTAGMQFRVRHESQANTEAALDASTRMTILGSGNVGIGTGSPQTMLDVGAGGVLHLTSGGAPHRFAANGAGMELWFDSTDCSLVTVCDPNDGSARISSIHRSNGSLFRWKDLWISGYRTVIDANGTRALTVRETGNVGIGTISPTEKLEVNGNIKASGTLEAGGLRVGQLSSGGPFGAFFGIGTTSPVSPLHVRRDLPNMPTTLLTLTNGGGFAGAGAALDFQTFDLGTNPPSARIIATDHGGFAASLGFWTKPTGTAATPLLERVRIESNGNVRIGGTSLAAPTHLLDLHGPARMRVNGSTNLLVNGSGDDAYIDLVKNSSETVSARIEFNGFTNQSTHLGSISFLTRGDDGQLSPKLSISQNGEISFPEKIGYVSVPSQAWRPSTSGDGYGVNNGYFQPRPPLGFSGGYGAPLYLPDGVTVTEVLARLVDLDDEDNYELIFEAHELATDAATVLGRMRTEGHTLPGQNYISSINFTVDNSKYAYSVKTFVSSGNTFGIQGIRIKYTYTKP